MLSAFDTLCGHEGAEEWTSNKDSGEVAERTKRGQKGKEEMEGMVNGGCSHSRDERGGHRGSLQRGGGRGKEQDGWMEVVEGGKKERREGNSVFYTDES